MQNDIERFLQYDGDYAKKWLIQAVSFTVSLNRNDKLITDIFELCKIETNVNTFLSNIEDCLKENNDAKYDKNRSPTELTNYINTWVYYSMFWAFDLKDLNKNNDRKYRLITRMALEFHYHYLKYITFVDEDSRINIKSIEYAAITVGRAIEILEKIAQKKSAYLTEKYFPQDVDDLFTHFINIVGKDYVEKECFSIKLNEDRKDETFIKYYNPYVGIDFQLLPSRRLSTGSNNINEVKKEDENKNIIDYLLQGYVEYKKIVGLKRGKGKNKNKFKIKNRLSDQVTQEEKLIKGNVDQVHKDEETLEEDMHQESKVRASSHEDVKVIPDQFKQRMINRLVSASITQQNRMLSSTYEIPPLENLTIFINHLTRERLSTEFSKRNLYISVFILSIILGREYQDILESLIKGKSNGCKIIIEKKLFSVKLDDKLFGSSIEGFSMQNGKNISFKLPIEIVELYEYIQKQILHLPEDSQENLYKNEKQYIKFIDERRDSCPIYINFDLKNMWKILVTYSKNLFENNIASLFCIGKYTTHDRSALSYTSTHKSGQIHSNFLNDIYTDMGMQECINHLLDTDEIVVNEEYLFDKKMEYVGSNRLIKDEDVKKFFSHMRRAMLLEDDQIKYFNLYAVYARYALSLLIATRYGRVSCSLKYISFELGLIRIIEKADDNRTGVRFIPLCRQAKIIISKYKSLCSKLGFLGDDICFLDKKNKRTLYGENKKILVNIFDQGYDLDQNILDFIRKVPLNFGRHIAVKTAVENNFNMHYLQTMMGHYTKGTEQFGMVSSTDSQDYILKSSRFFGKVGKLYGI